MLLPHSFNCSLKVSKRRKKYFNQKLTAIGTLTAMAPQLSSGMFSNFQADNNTLTFMVARHPFHRLVSAFRDKLERLHVDDPAEYKVSCRAGNRASLVVTCLAWLAWLAWLARLVKSV